ncbi:hypothetical protein SGRA_2043 [Saprospira grandis str. Lewin]|uniref:Uncharacterized protein n=1 Tax=Saprospira grandis (strain Lewin) TaxID=984262 RepID=H6L2L7_SAPGL|nr:hypothetical protein [Saprospira grandis]AFC24774.1 hypothetical protein SGRA_2043 [Saprospira grandis str. Lewin]
MFWGCPGLWPGRAVSQLAGLLGPAALRALVWPSATAAHPSADALGIRPAQNGIASRYFNIGPSGL